jgi:hypothetical protein
MENLNAVSTECSLRGAEQNFTAQKEGMSR